MPWGGPRTAGRSPRSPTSPAPKAHSSEILRQEKLREDRLRALGYEVVRLTWADLDDPGRVHDLITSAFARAAARAA